MQTATVPHPRGALRGTTPTGSACPQYCRRSRMRCRWSAPFLHVPKCDAVPAIGGSLNQRAVAADEEECPKESSGSFGTSGGTGRQ
jgi:hypothetical protein